MKIRSTAAILFASALAFAAYADPPQRTADASMDRDTSKFFEKVASADQLEIESGRLAAHSATDPKLREFGQKMASEHSQADQELRSLASRKGVTLPMAMSDSNQKKLAKLREEKPGKDFDNEFRDLMVDSHKEAVSLFEDTAKGAKDPEVKAFAARMLPTIQQHEHAAKALPKK
jgi:putative membrane protein